MSFRLFVYYCALVGGWAAFVGWFLGVNFAPGADHLVARNGVIGMFLGVFIALGLGLVDAFWVLPVRQAAPILSRVGVAVLIGGGGGLLGGGLGQLLVEWTELDVVFVLGWTLLGALCGASVGAFGMIEQAVRKAGPGGDRPAARAKLLKCVLGGLGGGILGGTLAVLFRGLFADSARYYFPTALGFVALGVSIGLLVGLTQVILKEAWVRVEAGFRPGRELILAKTATTIGRGEGSDIALFGDSGVEKEHARIVRDGVRYYLQESASASGTFLNDQLVTARTALRSGDVIRIGKSLLRFFERQKPQP
jgi:hypothetical protein